MMSVVTSFPGVTDGGIVTSGSVLLGLSDTNSSLGSGGVRARQQGEREGRTG
jgi:hypothetical protein